MGHTNLHATTTQRGLPRLPRISAGARTCSRVEWSGMMSLLHECRFKQLRVRLPGVDEEASAQCVTRDEERMTFSLSDHSLLFDGPSEAPSRERAIRLSPVDRRRLARSRMNPTTPRSSRRLRVEGNAPRRDAVLRSRAGRCTHQLDTRTVRPLAICDNSELHGVAAIGSYSDPRSSAPKGTRSRVRGLLHQWRVRSHSFMHSNSEFVEHS